MSSDLSNQVSPKDQADGLPTGLLWLVRVLSLVAAASSCYLIWISYRSGPVPGCVANSFLDCEHVVTSVWSRWLEIPVSILGGATYLSIFAVSWFVGGGVPESVRRVALHFMLILVVMAGGAALWFTGLQIFSVGKLCQFCIISHLSGVAIAAAFLTYARSLVRLPSVSIGAGLLAVAGLIGGQILFPHKTFVVEEYPEIAPDASSSTVSDAGDANSDQLADDNFLASPVENLPAGPTDDGGAGTGSSEPAAQASSDSEIPDRDLLVDLPNKHTEPKSPVHEVLRPAPERTIRYYPRQSPINIYEYPHLGDPEAPHVLVEVLDYTCKHCRHMYGYLEAARERYGSDLTIVLRPIANNSKCNAFIVRTHPDHDHACEYLKLALAVWFTAPSRFEEYHDWLMSGTTTPSVERATQVAEQLVGAELLRKGMDDQRISPMIQGNHQLWKNVGGSLPLLLASSRKTNGVPSSESEFFDVLGNLIGPPNQAITNE